MSNDYQTGQITQPSEAQIKDGFFGMDFASGASTTGEVLRLRELLESSRGQCARLIEENKRLRAMLERLRPADSSQGLDELVRNLRRTAKLRP